MQTVLYEKQFPTHDPIDLGRWQQQMHTRIQQWYNSTPRSDRRTDQEQKVIDNFELTFHRGLFYLYHPAPNIPLPSASALINITEAATNMIQLYRRFFCEHTLTIYWQAVENLSSAGIALIFSYVNSTKVQERLTFRSLEALVHSCSSVLWGMVEHFPAFKVKRDAFDIMASEILADLTSGSVVPDGPQRLFSWDNISAARRKNAPMYAGNTLHSIRQPGVLSETGREDEPRFHTSLSVDGIRVHQGLPHPLSGIGRESNNNIPQAPFLFSEFDDVPFDWGIIENTNEFFTPIWL
jgi:hypothetical protein